MQETNRMGLRVVLLTGVTVLLVFAIIAGVRILFFSIEEPVPTVAPPTPDAAPEGLLSSQDSDQDGLQDDLEILYQTNPALADTDQDGTNDGDEIIVLRNPTIPAPGDELFPEGADEGTLDTSTYTGRYLALLPVDADQADVLSRERLKAFVEEEQGSLSVSAFSPSIVESDAKGAAAIDKYLGLVSSSHNPDLSTVTSDDISAAFSSYYGQGQQEELTTIVGKLEANTAVLEKVPAPEEVTELHKQLVAASMSLLENTKLLEQMKVDFVGGLVGASNIESLGSHFEDIAGQISALEEKYSLD